MRRTTARVGRNRDDRMLALLVVRPKRIAGGASTCEKIDDGVDRRVAE